MRKDNCPWEQLSTRYGNQMVVWRHLEVKRVKFFKLPNFCWRSRTFGLQFWVSPLPVLCLASKWFYFFSCHVIGLAESRQHSPAPGWGWCFGPSVQAGSMPATLPVRSHPDIPCFHLLTPRLTLQLGPGFLPRWACCVCCEAWLLEPSLTDQGVEMPP